MEQAAYTVIYCWDALRVPKNLGEWSLKVLHAQLT